MRDPVFAAWMEHGFVRQVELFNQGTRNRLLPAFDSIQLEAEGESSRVWSEYMSQPGDDGDPSVAAESAMDAGVELLTSLAALRQSVVNLLVVGLYHLFEQQKLEAESRLGHIDWGLAPSWRTVEELKVAANAVKHGEGSSAVKLRQLRPDLFVDPVIKRLGVTPPSSPVVNPMAGEDIWLEPADLALYADAVIDLWRETAKRYA